MSITDGELAIAAAEAGAVVVRERFGASLARIDKGDGDFATAADVEAEEAIVAVLGAARPEDYVIGEEGGRRGTGGSGRTWLVDPLCGTLNFAARTSLVSVNVALKGGSAAAVADPFAGEVFWTAGTGAFVRRAGIDEKLTPEVGARLVDVNLDPPFPNDPEFRAVLLLADREFVAGYRPRVVSTALAVAWTAAGRRAAYISDGHTGFTVHSAAGIALCRAAGCVVTNLHGQALHSGVGGILVAADAATHADLLRLVGKQIRPR
jgi:myo-inositol-1(or 4)-monophosphatase